MVCTITALVSCALPFLLPCVPIPPSPPPTVDTTFAATAAFAADFDFAAPVAAPKPVLHKKERCVIEVNPLQNATNIHACGRGSHSARPPTLHPVPSPH